MDNSELKKNMRIGFFLIGVMLVAIAGFYSFAVMGDFNNECSECLGECMDNDRLCGDFGIYYFKFFTLVGIGVMGISLSFESKDFFKNKEVSF